MDVDSDSTGSAYTSLNNDIIAATYLGLGETFYLICARSKVPSYLSPN